MPRHLGIVLPTYNRKAYLLEALRGFFAEELPPSWKLSLVVVDDGGTDETEEALKQAGYLNKITYIYQTNAERAVARNQGARAIAEQVDWLLFFDSDDLIVPGALKQYLQVAESCAEQVVAIYGAIQIWPTETAPRLTPLTKIGPSGDLSKLVLERAILPLGATLLKAKVFLRLGGFHEDRSMIGSEDFNFLVRLALAGEILALPQKTVFYRQHTGSTLPENYLRSTESAVRHLGEALRQKYSNRELKSAESQLAILATKGQIGALNRTGYRGKAFEAWFRLLRRYPQILLRWSFLKLFLSLGKGIVSDFVHTLSPRHE